MNEMNWTKKKQYILSSLLLLTLIVIGIYSLFFIDFKALSETIEQLPFFLKMFAMMGLMILQIVIAFLPGEPLELASGYLCGSFFYYCKSKTALIAEIDLSLSVNRMLMKYVLIHTVIIIALIILGGFGIFLSNVYMFILFFWLKDKVKIIQQDYHKLLIATKELGNGNFEAEINDDLGVFNSLKDEFNHIKAGFETAVKEEIKSQNMKTELISNVSHDLITPLTCIKNYIILLQNEALEEKQRKEYLENLNQYTNRLTTLIEDLFEVSKVNSGNVSLNSTMLNIIALLDQSCAESSDIMNSKNLTLVKQYDNNEYMVYLDGDKTYRIFENLLSNIGKYAMGNSRVYLEVKEENNKVKLVFKNISEMPMNFTGEEISERFVRGDSSRHESGSGLGLAIAKSFTEVQGGDFMITVDGDLFKVTIAFDLFQSNSN